MKSAIRFESLADRINFKKRQHAKLEQQREMMEASDRSISMLVFYFIPATTISFLLLVIVLLSGRG